MKPRDLASLVRQLEHLGPDTPVDKVIEVASAVAAAAPQIATVLDAVGDLLGAGGDSDLEAKVTAAIERAAARNRSGDVRRELEAELAAIQAADTDPPTSPQGD